ncbi:MAG TPA: dipeptidase, partial [Actinotalea sp.]|nr:dipeptidase [Actinotalea sp.]
MLRARVAAGFGDLRADLEALVRIPGVSSPAFDQAHVQDSAEAVATLLRGAGLADARVLTARRPDGLASRPAVVGHLP